MTRSNNTSFRYYWLSAFGAYIVIAVLARIGLVYGLSNGYVTTIWIPDAILLAFLLRSPRRQWGLFILAGILGDATANYLTLPTPMTAIALAAISNLGPVIGAILLIRHDQPIDITRRNDLLKFFVAAALIAPALSASTIVLSAYFFSGFPSLWLLWRTWFLEHALGSIVVTPALLVVSITDLREAFGPKQRKDVLLGLAVVAGTSVLTFSLSHYPLLFLIYPALIFATFRSGFVGASLGTLLIGIIGSAMTFTRKGPIAVLPGESYSDILLLQCFLAIVFLTAIPIATTMAEIRKSQRAMMAARQNLAEQNRLLQLAEKIAHIGHWRFNLATSDFFWSDETYRIHGRNKADFTPQLGTITDTYHPDDIQLVDHAIKRALALGENHDIFIRLIRPDGEIRHIRSHRQVELDTNGKPRMLFGVLQDVTDIKRTEQALKNALADARKANRAKSDFLASMSHELRTPLNAIIGFSELLLFHPKEHLSALQQEYLGYVLSGGKHLLQLVKDVLDLATIESGRLNVKIDSIDLYKLLQEAEAFLRPLALEKKLVLESTTLSDGPLPHVRADYGRLLQVLLNLGSNAIKYNRPGGSLGITATVVQNGKKIRISVTDTGNGIPANRQTEVFEPFNRLGAENGAIEGTGIGLSICRQLMGLMGGTIAFSSIPGSGSVFWIEIDCAEPITNTNDETGTLLDAPYV